MTSGFEVTGNIPEVYWFRDNQQVAGDSFDIRGSLAFASSVKPEDLVLTYDDQPVEVTFAPPSEQISNAFWFLPPENVRGLRFTLRGKSTYSTDGSDAANYHELSMRTLSTAFNPALTFQWCPKFANFTDTPPNENIERVSGKGATGFNYWCNGRTDYDRFSQIAQRHGVDVASPFCRILDWGSGCGRLNRHWLADPQRAGHVRGVDIDPVNIAWSKEHLDRESFDLCGLVPPLPFAPDRKFDLIIGNSVLTHLKLDVMREWLAEIASRLTANGRALLSFHGNFSVVVFSRGNQPFWQKMQSEGFDATRLAAEINSDLAEPDYYRQTYMSDEFAMSLFSEYFKVEAVYPGVVSRYQNIAVLAPKGG